MVEPHLLIPRSIRVAPHPASAETSLGEDANHGHRRRRPSAAGGAEVQGRRRACRSRLRTPRRLQLSGLPDGRRPRRGAVFDVSSAPAKGAPKRGAARETGNAGDRDRVKVRLLHRRPGVPVELPWSKPATCCCWRPAATGSRCGDDRSQAGPLRRGPGQGSVLAGGMTVPARDRPGRHPTGLRPARGRAAQPPRRTR